MASITRLSSGQKLVIAGAALAVLCFFLPWLSATTGPESVGTLTGWQLMAGSTVLVHNFFIQEEVQLSGVASLFLVLLPGLAVFGFAYNAIRRGSPVKVDSLVFIGLGILPLLVLAWALQGGAGPGGSIQFGVFGVAIGYGVVIIGGILGWIARPTLIQA